MNPDGVVFGESAPVSDEGLTEVRGTGLTTPSSPPSDLAVILWDEQPKIKPAPNTPADSSSSQTGHTSIRVR